jgi:hypothetical protein
MSMTCSICRHPERTLIDRAIANGQASARAIAAQYGLTKTSVLRHAVNHLQAQAMAGPASVAQEVVQAVRDQREREQGEVARIWDQRLHSTYETVRRGMERAENDPEHWTQVAKFAMAAVSAIETGMRACGTLAGGAETRVQINVEQLLVLPSAPTPKVIKTKALPESS